MSIQITDTVQTIKYVESPDVEHVFTKSNTQIRVKGNSVELRQSEFSKKFLFSEVTVPTSVSAIDLASQLNDIINTNPSGNGQTLNFERTITEFSDWADPSSPGGGCVVTATTITLELNFTYKVSGQQPIEGRTFIANGKNMFYGTSNSDGVFNTGAIPLYETNVGDTFFINLLKSSGDGTGSMWDVNASGSPLEQILVVASEISGFASMGTVNDIGVYRYEACFFVNLADGTTMGGVGFLISFINNDITIDSGIFLDLGTAVYSSITFRGQDFAFSDTTATMISGLPSSGNLALGGSGQLLSNTFLGPGAYISGIDKGDLQWNFDNNQGNQGTQDSVQIGAWGMSGNATATTISVSSTFVDVAGTGVASPTLERFTFSTGPNELTVTGLSSAQQNIEVSFTAFKVGGATNEIEMCLLRDTGGGYAIVPGACTIIDLQGTRKDSSTIIFDDVVEEGYMYKLQVANNDDTNDITVENLNMIIK